MNGLMFPIGNGSLRRVGGVGGSGNLGGVIGRGGACTGVLSLVGSRTALALALLDRLVERRFICVRERSE